MKLLRKTSFTLTLHGSWWHSSGTAPNWLYQILCRMSIAVFQWSHWLLYCIFFLLSDSQKASCAQGRGHTGRDVAGPTELWTLDLMTSLLLNPSEGLRDSLNKDVLQRCTQTHRWSEQTGRAKAPLRPALRQIEGSVSAALNNTTEAFNIWVSIQSLPQCLQRGRTNIQACVRENDASTSPVRCNFEVKTWPESFFFRSLSHSESLLTQPSRICSGFKDVLCLHVYSWKSCRFFFFFFFTRACVRPRRSTVLSAGTSTYLSGARCSMWKIFKWNLNASHSRVA